MENKNGFNRKKALETEANDLIDVFITGIPLQQKDALLKRLLMLFVKDFNKRFYYKTGLYLLQNLEEDNKK